LSANIGLSLNPSTKKAKFFIPSLQQEALEEKLENIKKLLIILVTVTEAAK